MATESVDLRHTVAEFLAVDRTGTGPRREWIDGEIREMVGASHEHNVLCHNLLLLLGSRLRGEPFFVYPGDMKVRVPRGAFYYPDVLVVADPPSFEDDRRDIVLDPVVVVEVLSPSTESVDRGEKLAAYREIGSLVDYLLVDQSEPKVEHHARTPDGWHSEVQSGLESSLTVRGCDCRLPLDELYDRVL